MRQNGMLGSLARFISGQKDKQAQRPLASSPLPQRMSAADTNQYVQPLPAHVARYMTFWQGNQIPSSAIMDAPMMRNIQVSSQDYRTPQYTGGSFNFNLGQLPSVRLVEQMRAAWIARSRAVSGY